MRAAGRFGVTAQEPDVDLAAVWARIRALQETIAAGDDNPARYVDMGIEFRWGAASVTAAHEVTVRGADGITSTVTGRVILLCSGSQPKVPDIVGLCDAGYLTTDTLFDLEEIPDRMTFIGGGPVAVELAQACRRLGVTVTLLESGARALGREEPELVDSLITILTREGVDVVTGVLVDSVAANKTIVGSVRGKPHEWATDAIVVAVGRTVDTTSLDIAAVGVVTDARGVVVDGRGRTTVPSIYAAGDVTGKEMFTHAAAHQAVMAVRDAFFPGRAPTEALVPAATFTDPELARAGVTIDQAVAAHGARHVRVYRWSLAHNDRAQTDATEGAIVLVEHIRFGRRRLIGAHVLAEGAGELIGELALAIQQGLSVSDLGGIIHVYPTIATSIQQLGGRAALEQALKYRWLMRLWARR